MTTTGTTVARGAAALYAANIVTLGLNTLYLVLLTNLVSLQEVGLVSLLNVIIGGVATLSTLALPLSGSGVAATPPAVTKFISQYMKGRGSAKRVYLSSATICFVLSVSTALAISLPGTSRLLAPQNESLVVVLAGGDAILFSFAQLGGYSLLGSGMATLAGRLMIVSSLVRYAAASVLLSIGFGPTGVFIGFAIGDALMAGAANVFSYRKIEHARREAFSMKPVIIYMVSVFLAAAMGFAVSQTDKLLAFFQQGLGNLAVYNVAAVGAGIASFAPNAVVNVLVPALSANSSTAEEKRDTLRRYTRYVTFTAAPMGFALAAVSPALLRIFGDAYAQAAPVMAVISLSIAPTAIASVYSSSLLVEDGAHHFTVSSLTALLGLVVVAVVSVPVLGLLGIALGRSAMLFIMLGSVAYFVRKRKMLVLDLTAYAKSLVASSVMATLIFVPLSSIGLFFMIGRAESVALAAAMMFVGLITYFVVMKWLNAFTLSDVDLIEAVLPNQLRWLTEIARKRFLAASA